MDVTILHKSENENNAHIVCRLEEAYLKFREKFESSNDEVSKMISMFLVKMESYARCKFSVRNADAITMEKEGCEWIPYWKQSGKKQYFQAGIRRIETLYKSLLNGEISEEDFEIMRRNRFCRLTLGKGALAMDELCELMNYFMKSVVYSPYFDTTCERSKHVPLMRRCAIELWGHTEPRSSVSCGSTSDYKLILEMCNNERIFSDEIGARILDETCFWRFIKQDKSQKGGSTRQRAKDSVPLTPHESSFLSRTNNVDINEIDAVFDENDDEDRSTCSSTADSVETRNDRVLDDDIANIMIDTDVAETNAWENMTGEDRAMLAVSELKKLGNTARHKINKHCLLNTFESGKILCKNLKQQREKEIIADQRRLDIIYLAVKYFKMKMRDRIRRLDIAIAKSKQCTRVYELSLMEEKYREIRQTKKWKVGSKI
jgi:hypothetical protein